MSTDHPPGYVTSAVDYRKRFPIIDRRLDEPPESFVAMDPGIERLGIDEPISKRFLITERRLGMPPESFVVLDDTGSQAVALGVLSPDFGNEQQELIEEFEASAEEQATIADPYVLAITSSEVESSALATYSGVLENVESSNALSESSEEPVEPVEVVTDVEEPETEESQAAELAITTELDATSTTEVLEKSVDEIVKDLQALSGNKRRKALAKILATNPLLHAAVSDGLKGSSDA